MKHSDALDVLAPALNKVHAELKAIAKDGTNPHFKSKFMTYDAIMDVVRPLCAKHGLSVIQGAATPHTDTEGTVTALAVDTMLLHVSGQWVANSVTLPVGTVPIKDENKKVIGEAPTAQTAGATVTYGRRYGIAALLAIAADEDDDGNRASERHAPRGSVSATPTSRRVVDAITTLPKWNGYEFADMPLTKAPVEELRRLLEWRPAKDAGRYEPLKDAIQMELDRRRADFNVPHEGLKEPKDDGLPF